MTLGELVNQLLVVGFEQYYLLLLVGIVLIVAVILFTRRFTGPEALVVGVVLTYGLFSENINPLFTSLWALALFVVAFLVAYVIWQKMGIGGQP